MENEEISNEDFLKAFGINQEETEETPQETNEGTEETPAEEVPAPEQDGEQDASEDNKPSETTNNNQDNTKQAQAFAFMRSELNQKNKMLNDVAVVLGLDPKSKDSMAQLQTKLTEALAKQQGIPSEILEKLNRLETLENERNIETIRNNAFNGFQQVKSKFGLNDQELEEFANELVRDGKNPFTQSVDLLTEYKLKNFDKLLEQAKQQGIQAEMERASKASKNASTPSKTHGGAEKDEPEKITTVKGLTDWFNQQSGK
ncbi:MAG: hypothetical protein MJ191_00180 [Clostridium sp.]|nr:hypothetical protein [Clostridium sp.]